MKKYVCPKCGRDVPIDNINVAKDIMLCPSCGEASSFSEIVGEIDSRRHEDELFALLGAPPPKHLKVTNDPNDFSGRIVLTHRRFTPMSFFLVPFTCVWAGGSMFGIYGMQFISGKFDLSRSLFGLPFAIGSIILITICLFALGIGKSELKLERGKGRSFWGVGPFGWGRSFTYDSRTQISRRYLAMRGNRRSVGEILLTDPDNTDTTHICSGMDDDSLDYVEAVLRREIGRV